MKKLFLILIFISLFQKAFSQTKELPACNTIKNELDTIGNSFDNIVERFKSKEDKVSLIKTYFSEFSICGEKGKIKDYGRNVEFIFNFTDADYNGDRTRFRDFYKKIFRKLKDVFASTHVYKVSKSESSKSGYFYERDKEISSSKRNIKLVLLYKAPEDQTTAYSVSLVFDYYPKR